MYALTDTKLGQYHLIHLLAQGGMSEVYLASDEQGEQAYAVKVVERTNDEHYWRLRKEIQILNFLRHPHILPLLDYGEQDGMCYYATPYIEYGTLKQRIATGPMDAAEAGAILSQIADALQFMHELGIVHRDIKPANILLGKANEVWLADFGLAGEINSFDEPLSTNRLFGTPLYMAPELMEKPANATSDVYALGVVLYEMLTGEVPFTGTTPLSICWKHLNEPLPLPSTVNPLISLHIEQVILRALHKNPLARFPTIRSLAETYENALTQLAMIEAIEQEYAIEAAQQDAPGTPKGRRVSVLASTALAAIIQFGQIELSSWFR